jgi:plastocyanin
VSNVSSSPFSFDIFYDSVNYTYLLAYENAAGLQVQFLNQNFVKQGTPKLIEGGVSNTNPRLSYDAAGKKFLIFWLSTNAGTPRKVLKDRVLSPQGVPSSDARTVGQTAGANTYGSLSVSTNQKNGTILAIVQELSNPTSGKLLGFTVRPDGTKIRSALLQPPALGFLTVGDAAFSDAGTGFAFWSDRSSVKYKKLSAAAVPAGATKAVANVADASSFQPSILLDSVNGQFIGVWGQSNKIRALALNSAGTITKQSFDVASSSVTSSKNVATSYDGQLGNAIVVWEDLTTNGASQKFKIRAAIFFIATASTGSTITVGDNFFSPASITVRAGTTVTWNIQGTNGHTVTSGTESSAPGSLFDTAILRQGQSFSFRFNNAGTFTYFCRNHGQNVMSGTIIVQSSGEPPTRY